MASTLTPFQAKVNAEQTAGLSTASGRSSNGRGGASAFDGLLQAAEDRPLGVVEPAPDQREHRSHEQVFVSVSDEGAGVTPGAERVIFERGGSVAGGTGVGLHLARSLVEAENGRLRVASGHPSRFEIVFPRS